MFDYLICDCDGVLVDSEAIADRVLFDTLSATFPGIDFRADVKSAFGQQTSRFLASLEPRHAIAMPPDFTRTIERITADELARSLQAVPGVGDALRQVPLPLAVVSNSQRARVRLSLERAGLTELFGANIFSAEQVARPKPAPDVYLHAAATLGVAPARCLVVEDSVAGLTAANAAGMTTLAFIGASHIPDGYEQRLIERGFTRIVRDMRELPARVRAELAGAPARTPT
jgi:HAD superfamily hydrolase (TIGR01509 family)